MPKAAQTKKKKAQTAKAPKKGGVDYDALKFFQGQQYTGMQIGRSHKWNYDAGVWREKKITPDKWELTYSVTKRRAGKAPRGSGVPVGTGYHWFILAHQFVHKLNEDDYSTGMVGVKLKLAHQRASKKAWNISETTQRKHLIEMLKEYIKALEEEPAKFETIPLKFEAKGETFEGFAVPLMESCQNGICKELDVTLNDTHYGIIRRTDKGWRMTDVKPQSFVNAIGEAIFPGYE